jgi:ABC-2 type transport system permease protein
MRAVLAIAGNSLTRFRRDRMAMFFAVAMPVFVIVLVATLTGVDTLRLAVVGDARGPSAAALVSRLEALDGIKVHERRSLDAARQGLRRGEYDAVVFLPAGLDDALRRGEHVEVPVYADRANTSQQAAALTVRGAVAAHAATVFAASFATRVATGDFDENLRRAGEQTGAIGRTGVEATTIDAKDNVLPSGFSYAAPTQLVLFVFVLTLGAAALVIQSRRERLYTRVLAAPVRPAHIIGGETLAYLGTALFASALIVGVGLLFGAKWGDPFAAAALVFVFALVGTGFGMAAGALFGTVEQAMSIGQVAGVGMAMLGGCMWPLEIVPPAMRTAGHFTPHGWAVDGWTELIAQDAGLADIAANLGVLAVFAAVSLGLAVGFLRRALTN